MKHTSGYGSAVVLAGLFGLAMAAGATEEAAADGAGLQNKITACQACHGENGAKPILPEYPILAGQHADYLATALRAYRDGRRKNAIMVAQIAALQLSDSDIDQIAAHFSTLDGVKTLHK